jgi:hypothetical protein
VADVLLATCAALPDGDEDAGLLTAALARRGLDACWVSWTDESVDWSAAPVVLRSTWDYTLRRSDFLDWVASVPWVLNPAAVVRWNSDKVYLQDLHEAGVPITPTAAVRPGEPLELPTEGEFVVKPSVGAGSRGAGRFTPDRADAAREHASALHRAGRTVLVQPYLDGVDDAGETALVHLDGVFSHAIRKGPMLADAAVYPIDETRGLFVEENISAREPSSAELAVGAAALAHLADRFGDRPLYARVDLLPSPEGPVVVELELTEPSLFLQYGDGDVPADRFAAAIAGRL